MTLGGAGWNREEKSSQGVMEGGAGWDREDELGGHGTYQDCGT